MNRVPHDLSTPIRDAVRIVGTVGSNPLLTIPGVEVAQHRAKALRPTIEALMQRLCAELIGELLSLIGIGAGDAGVIAVTAFAPSSRCVSRAGAFTASAWPRPWGRSAASPAPKPATRPLEAGRRHFRCSKPRARSLGICICSGVPRGISYGIPVALDQPSF